MYHARVLREKGDAQVEFIVVALVPTTAAEPMLQGLFDELDLTGGKAEVLFGEANEEAVHIAFQIEASNEREATFEVIQTMSPVLTSLGSDATKATYDAHEAEAYEKKERRRLSFQPKFLLAGLVGACAITAMLLHGLTEIESGRHGRAVAYLITMIMN